MDREALVFANRVPRDVLEALSSFDQPIYGTTPCSVDRCLVFGGFLARTRLFRNETQASCVWTSEFEAGVLCVALSMLPGKRGKSALHDVALDWQDDRGEPSGSLPLELALAAGRDIDLLDTLELLDETGAISNGRSLAAALVDLEAAYSEADEIMLDIQDLGIILSAEDEADELRRLPVGVDLPPKTPAERTADADYVAARVEVATMKAKRQVASILAGTEEPRHLCQALAALPDVGKGRSLLARAASELLAMRG